VYVDRRAARTAVAWRFAGTWWDSTVRFVVLAHPVGGCIFLAIWILWKAPNVVLLRAASGAAPWVAWERTTLAFPGAVRLSDVKGFLGAWTTPATHAARNWRWLETHTEGPIFHPHFVITFK